MLPLGRPTASTFCTPTEAISISVIPTARESREFAQAKGIPFDLRFAPDGKRVRFSVRDTNRRSTALWEVTAQGQDFHPVLPNWKTPPQEAGGTWTPDGRYFLFQSASNNAQDIWALREEKSIFQKNQNLPAKLTVGPLLFSNPTPGADGTKLFVIGQQRRFDMIRFEGQSGQSSIYLPGISAGEAAFANDEQTKDGQTMVYVVHPEGTLWRSKTDGSARTQLTFAPMQVHMPRWSPDGRQIVFMASASGSALEALSASGRRRYTPGIERWRPQSGRSDVDPGREFDRLRRHALVRLRGDARTEYPRP